MEGGGTSLPPGYERVRRLGSGGFGEVVLARHVRLDRLVAIKHIHGFALGDDEAKLRFRREAQVLVRADCEQVVDVYDLVNTDDGAAHLVMEYVPGGSLADLVAAGPLPVGQALPILRDVADALAFAAAHGIVHRDVKPPNVFVLPHGRAKLGDFGLARVAADPAVFRTTVGSPLGTPAYYPPELSSTDAEPDARSDGYSFAVMAYETLTGRRPFEADDVVSLITAHWRLEPPDPAQVVPGFPRSASAALLRGLSKDPATRLLPRDLVDLLERVPSAAWPALPVRTLPSPSGSRHDPTVVTPSPPPSAVATPVRAARRRGVAGRPVLLAAGALLLATAVAGLVWRGGGTGPPSARDELVVTSAAVGSDPASGRVRCPRGTVRFTASFETNGAAGSFAVRWTRPDGVRTPTRLVRLEAGQRSAQARLEVEVSGRRPVRGDATVEVLMPAGPTATAPLRYLCPGR